MSAGGGIQINPWVPGLPQLIQDQILSTNFDAISNGFNGLATPILSGGGVLSVLATLNNSTTQTVTSESPVLLGQWSIPFTSGGGLDVIFGSVGVLTAGLTIANVGLFIDGNAIYSQGIALAASSSSAIFPFFYVGSLAAGNHTLTLEAYSSTGQQLTFGENSPNLCYILEYL